MHHGATCVVHPIFQTNYPCIASNQNTKMKKILCVFWIFFLTFHVIVGIGVWGNSKP